MCVVIMTEDGLYNKRAASDESRRDKSTRRLKQIIICARAIDRFIYFCILRHAAKNKNLDLFMGILRSDHNC